MDIQPLPPNKTTELLQLYDTFDRPVEEHPSSNSADKIVDLIRSQNGEIFVAIVNENIVGTYAIYICFNLTRNGKPFAVIENVVSDPKIRRKGIGRAMMNHAVKYAQENGCYKLFLQSGAKREETKSFYLACGFKNDKRGYQIRFAN